MQFHQSFSLQIKCRIVSYYIGMITCVIIGFGFFGNFIAAWIYIPDNNYQTKCTETTCLLNVFKNRCYAKFEFYPGANWELVNCHGHKGYYNTTVPCNADDENGKPIIYCEKNRMNEQVFGCLIIIYQVFNIIAGFSFVALPIILHENLTYYLKSLTPIGDKMEEPDPKLIELDDA